MSQTKIVVIQKKELVYTGIFAGLAILLLILVLVMFLPSKKDHKTSESAYYHAGVYNTELVLGDNTLNLEVVVDTDQIKSVSFVNLEESVSTMYPLIQPSLASIEEQLKQGTSIDDIPLSEKSKYTESLLIEGIKSALAKAQTDRV